MHRCLACRRAARVFRPVAARALLVAVAAGLASAAPQPRTDINPGLLYWQAFAALPRLNDADRTTLDRFAEQLSAWSNGSAPTDAVVAPPNAQALVGRYTRSMELLQRARESITPCDWGADPTDGPDMLVPDTRGVRELTKVAVLQAALQLDLGRADESVDTLLADLTLARNFAKDGTLVSVLVQQGAEGLFVDYMAARLGRYPVSAIARLRQGLTQLPPRVTVMSSVALERNFSRWMVDQVNWQVQRQGGEGSKAYAASRDVFLDLFGPQKPAGEKAITALDQATGGTVEGLRRLLDDLDSWFDRAQRLASAGPDTVKQATAEFAQRLENSSNPIASAVIPNIGRARTRELANVSRWAMLEAGLAQATGGAAAFVAVVDPLSGISFRAKSVDRTAVEFRSQTNLGPELSPVLRTLRAQTQGR